MKRAPKPVRPNIRKVLGASAWYLDLYAGGVRASMSVDGKGIEWPDDNGNGPAAQREYNYMRALAKALRAHVRLLKAAER